MAPNGSFGPQEKVSELALLLDTLNDLLLTLDSWNWIKIEGVRKSERERERVGEKERGRVSERGRTKSG